ncbi:M2 family metallopeptidase [Candidatus Viadribacter manganicus]|uniref:Peptidyl-dipeptidase n=1 Tax=Candidatus Viadribacter manganicus TaxID=1759059 RepID=A0A1B1ALJ2_9PROT|nr:M2 family metallopeptidase [Candidatus Viadribacter manganicus]ANP47400.1 peptidyl-dipeptidase [Candidatus Viadribacter manganicus]
MFAKPLLRTATSWIAIAALAACATTSSPTGASNANGPATAQSAAAFVQSAEEELLRRSEYEGRVAWVYNTNITFDTEWLLQRADAEGTEARVRLASEAGRYANVELPADTRRKVDLLRLSLVLPAPQREGAASELSEITTRLASTYSTGRIEYQGRQVTLDELETLMGTERNPARLEEMWTKWHAVAAPMRDDYTRMVEIANEGARDLGFDNVGQMWLSNYDMPAADMEAEVERLWGQLQPFYEQLHCYVRARLNDRYGDAVVPEDQPIRADLLGNMWAQDWSTLMPIARPPGARATYDTTQLLTRAHYTPVQMTETAERFYTSLGFPELPDTFWERSLLTRPRDRDVVCHASAWDIDNVDDLRVKQCIQINAEHFQTIHHELGHNFYQRAYNQQPYLYRNGAHDGFHEAIGDFVALNITPEYLTEIGLLRRNQIPSASSDVSLLMERALEKISFLPFALTMDQWRWQVFDGRITPDRYNAAWWELRERYQGIRPPNARDETMFDPGAKYHIAANVPYLRYFLSYVLQFQFYEAACRQAGWEGPLHRCTVYGNREVGERFARMLEMGASHPWPDALEAFTGTRQMDGGAMARYFQPLMSYMQEENRGRTCGW